MSIVSLSTHTPCDHCWTHVVIRIGQVHLYTYHVSKSLDMSIYELPLSHTVPVGSQSHMFMFCHVVCLMSWRSQQLCKRVNVAMCYLLTQFLSHFSVHRS